jgi:hypothetical protein
MGKIKEFAPFDGRDFEYIESYLCDMAKKGLVLERYGLCYAEFKESEPIQRRFRIVPKLQRMVTDEEIELYKESGWNYLGKKWGSGLNIFYTDNEDAPELFTDMGSFRSYAKGYALWSIAIIIIALYFIFESMFDSVIFYGSTGGIIHTFTEAGMVASVTFALMILSVIVLCALVIISSIKIMKRILKKEEIRHNVPYIRKLKFKIRTVKFAIAMILIMSIVIYANGFIIWNFGGANYEKEYNGINPVSMEVIDSENWQPVQKIIDTDDFGNEYVDFFVDKKDNFMIEYTNVHAQVNDIYYFANYCEARSEKIAEQWLIEDINYDTDFKLQADDIAMDRPLPEGIDYIGFYINEWDNQIVYVRAGKINERVEYSGKEDLREYVDVIINDVLN